ncbi:MAG: 3-oxoadipate--succinyl-CoA transferase [Nitrospinae bacterium]|nr:3-oxoadipate--succinyl-CoA transferase [Nitrospinota bacterium]
MGSRLASLPEHVIRAGNQMAVTLSRLIEDGEKVFHGVNSPLPMIAIFLAKKRHAPNCSLIEVAGSVDPKPRFMPNSTADPELCHGAASMFYNPDMYDLFARGGVDMAFLGAAQLDKQGRANMSYIGDPFQPKVRLPGGGGGAVIMPQVKRTVIWRTVHDRRFLVPRVDFSTQSGRLSHLVTPIALFEKKSTGLEIASVHPGHSVDEVIENTGFELERPSVVAQTHAPSAEELGALEELDPDGVRFTEFRF